MVDSTARQILTLVNLAASPLAENALGASGVPDYLAPKYSREGAAGLLAALPEAGDPAVCGALLRAALSDGEEDVRRRCLELLVEVDRGLAAVALCGASLDADPTVRSAALDWLLYAAPSVAVGVARKLTADEDDDVAGEAQRILDEHGAAAPANDASSSEAAARGKQVRAAIADRSPAARKAALAAYLAADGPRADAIAAAVAYDRDTFVRAAGRDALRSFAPSSADFIASLYPPR